MNICEGDSHMPSMIEDVIKDKEVIEAVTDIAETKADKFWNQAKGYWRGDEYSYGEEGYWKGSVELKRVKREDAGEGSPFGVKRSDYKIVD